MDISNMKNIVVLKNLNSNLVEEAIVVLKKNQKIKNHQYVPDKEEKPKVNGEDYIVKEAEMVVSSYITKMEEARVPKDIKLKKKYQKLRIITYGLAALSWLELVLLLI